MKRWQAILPVVLAGVIALLGSGLTYRWVNSQISPGPKVEEADVETVPIVVAVADMAWGTEITGEHLKLVSFLKESLPPGSFQDPTELEGRVLVAQMKQDEPILESRLAPTSVTTGGVAAIVTPGKRALAVRGDKVIGLSGLIKPGNRVDVLVTLTDKKRNREETKLVIQNIVVLATGSEMTETDDGESSPVDVYTLEVTPAEGEKLSLASTLGRLQLALRNAVDNEEILTKGATVPQALASFKYAVPATKKKKNKSTKSYATRVQIIKGNNVSRETFYQ